MAKNPDIDFENISKVSVKAQVIQKLEHEPNREPIKFAREVLDKVTDILVAHLQEKAFENHPGKIRTNRIALAFLCAIFEVDGVLDEEVYSTQTGIGWRSTTTIINCQVRPVLASVNITIEGGSGEGYEIINPKKKAPTK